MPSFGDRREPNKQAEPGLRQEARRHNRYADQELTHMYF
jgi:hypothetical protein